MELPACDVHSTDDLYVFLKRLLASVGLSPSVDEANASLVFYLTSVSRLMDFSCDADLLATSRAAPAAAAACAASI